MAARLVGSRALARLAAASAARPATMRAPFAGAQRSFAAVPHVADKVVHVTFSNNAGAQRRQAEGRRRSEEGGRGRDCTLCAVIGAL